MAQNQFRVGVALVAVVTLTATRSAQAYNYDTHRKMVETAVYVARHADSYVVSGPHPADWNQYIADVKAIESKVGQLQSGIADQESDVDDAPDANPEPWAGKPYLCGYNIQDKMDVLGKTRLLNAKYVPLRGKTAGGCGATAPDLSIYNNAFASTLGWLAGSVDNHLHDVVLWYRPTNALGSSRFKEAADKIGRAVIGTLLLPLVCVFEWIFGDGCDTNDAYDLADKTNPVHLIDSIIPGIHSHVSSDYTGLWHFEDVAAPPGEGEYNAVRGMLYENAGRSRPGVVDVGILQWADLVGLSLNAGESDGIGKYGQYDENERNRPDWQFYSLGHVEFSPLHNLARYGWDEFALYHPNSAAGLAWPLHALGDAAEPHHVWGTTSWGHRPFEDWVGRQWFDLTSSTASSESVSTPIGQQVLEAGYKWWGLISKTHDVAGLVTALAVSTNELGDFASDDTASLIYHTGSKVIAMNRYQSNANTLQTRVLLQNGMGAIVAFLTEAAKKAAAAPAITTTCPSATPYWSGTQCTSVDPRPSTIQVLDPGVCPSGSCSGAGGASGTGGQGGTGGATSCVASGDACSLPSRCCTAGDICAGVCRPPVIN